MSADSTYHPEDFLNADEICGYILTNITIKFQIDGLKMSREEAVEHFKTREALIRVRKLLIDESEKSI